MQNDDYEDQMTLFEEARTIDALSAAGVPLSVDPDVADEMGAFEEDALAFEDAQDSLFDELEASNG